MFKVFKKFYNLHHPYTVFTVWLVFKFYVKRSKAFSNFKLKSPAFMSWKQKNKNILGEGAHCTCTESPTQSFPGGFDLSPRATFGGNEKHQAISSSPAVFTWPLLSFSYLLPVTTGRLDWPHWVFWNFCFYVG